MNMLRALKALNLEKPDRIPTFEWGIHSSVLKKIFGSEIPEDYWAILGYDMWRIGTRSPSNASPSEILEETESHVIYKDWKGVVYKFDKQEDMTWIIGHTLSTIKNIKELKEKMPD